MRLSPFSPRRSAARLALLACAIWSAAAQAAVPELRGMPLVEALDVLRGQGLELAFTSELVRPEMRVEREPVASEPRLVLDEILAPHGLRVREEAGGLLVVVADTSRPAGSIRGRVVERRGGAIAGAGIRLVELDLVATSAADGSFAFLDLPTGRYTLDASATGHLEERTPVRVEGATTVVLHLHERPYIEDEIAVFPSRLALLEDESGSSFALDRETIESLPHLGGDLFRTMSLLPGVASNDVSAELSVHGGRRDEVRILLDGQELYSAFHLQDYDNALSVVPASNLAAATLTTGAYPASQGDRMSGVLDLRTVDPPSGTRFVLGLSVLDALFASSGRFRDDRGAWMFSGRTGSLALAADAIGDEAPQLWDLFVKADHAGKHGLLGARLLAAGDELEVVQIESDASERLETNYRTTHGWLIHQASPGERLLIESLGSWADLRRVRGGTGSEEDGSFLLDDRRDTQVLGLSQHWRLQLGDRHAVQWGLEGRRYETAFEYFKSIDPEIQILAPFSPPRVLENRLRETITGEHLGLWASDRIAVTDRLTLELGARWDRHTATGDTLLSPRVNLARRLGERAVLRAAWGRFFQSQRPYELQVEDGETELFPAERADHWVLGWERRPRRAPLGLEVVRVEVYRRTIDDPRPRYESLLEPLNFFPEIEPDRVRVAPRESSAEGVELLLRGRRGDRFGWWLSWARACAEDDIDGRDVPRPLDQPHTVTLDVGHRLPGQWNLNLAWRYRTGWPTTPVSAAFVPDPEEPEEEPELVAVFGPLRSRRLPDYHRLDLRASRTWTRGSGRITFFIDIQNLYDRANPAGFDVSLEEDEGVVLLESEDWPGIFPSLGIQWEF
jgi:outer membrane receptor protein involved in Fe transport